MQTPSAFLRDEAGAVTVDYVVLLAAATATALVVMTASSMSFGAIFRVTEEEMSQQGYVVGGWADVVRRYQPTNPVLYGALKEDFLALEDDELDVMGAFVDAYRSGIDQQVEEGALVLNESDQGILNDLKFAVDYVYVDRYRARPKDMEFEGSDVYEIATKMGWDSSFHNMFATPEVDTDAGS